jgi:hypothetical protein
MDPSEQNFYRSFVADDLQPGSNHVALKAAEDGSVHGRSGALLSIGGRE